MADILTISREEKDPKRIADVARQLAERLPATEALAASALQSPVANADLADMVQATVKGRAAAAGTGVPVDLTATQLLAIINTLSTIGIDASKLTLNKLSDPDEGGNISFQKSSGSTLSADVVAKLFDNLIFFHEKGGTNRGFRVDISACAAGAGTDLLAAFTSSDKGLVPASGGGTTNFLRADASFAAPPSGGLTVLSYAGAVGTGSTYTVTGLGGYKMFAVFLRDVSHNNGAAQSFRVELSGNGGSTWGSALNPTTGTTFAAASAVTGLFFISNIDQTNNQTATAGYLLAGSPTDTSSRGPIDALRFSFSAGNFDNGSIDIYGLK